MKQKFWKYLVSIFFLLLLTTSAQEVVDFITFGANGNPNEGDNDFKQIFFIKIEENAGDIFTLELFDPNCNGEQDQVFSGNFNSEFKFSLYGGSGAFTANTVKNIFSKNNDIHKGVLLKKLEISDEMEYDDKWMKFSDFNKTDGELVKGAYYFKLVVEGLSGDDGNVFNLRVSNSNVRILNYSPTVHLTPQSDPIEMRFNTGRNSKITIHNYDADNARVAFVSPYRQPIKLTSSNDGNWRWNNINLKPFEQNEICAIQFGPGKKSVNEAIFLVVNENKKLIPIELPVLTKIPNKRPVIVKEVLRGNDCMSVILDASKSYSNNGKKLSYKWVIPNSIIKRNAREEVTFSAVGKYPITLAIRENSASFESGTYKDFTVVINAPPKAVAGNKRIAAPKERIIFDGKKSRDTDGYITAYEWDFGDGNFSNKKRVSHSYDTPGIYNVKLKVTDNFEGNCNSDTDSLEVWVNATPIADAGNDIIVSKNEVVKFDGSNSYDLDGEIILYKWNFGDGRKSTGENVTHSFKNSGSYKVKLEVVDNSTAKNNQSSDELIVKVNNPPIAKAGKDRVVAVNELVKLNAGNSIDKDGGIIKYVWYSPNQFEDSLMITEKSFSTPGKYKVILKVKDNSGTNSAESKDVVFITVNAPPIAIAGDDVYQTSGEVLFDASKSNDPDGEIVSYYWDFGDGKSSTLKKVKHIYKAPGKYIVKLTVTDNSSVANSKATDELNVVINNKPIADAGPDIVVAPNEKFILSSSNSIDLDGSITSTKWYLKNTLISSEKDFEYLFDKPGKYTIELVVTDNSNDFEGIDYDNVVVHVNDAPHIITKESYRIAEGEEVTFDASKSFDTDGKIISYEWFLNDKTISKKPHFKYLFNQSGTSFIKLIVTDNSNVSNSVTEKDIEVFVNSSPVIKGIKNISSCNNRIKFSALDSYDSNNSLLSFTWNFGDGTTSYGKEIFHSYKSAGSYPVVLTIDDGENLSNSIVSSQIVVKINSAPIAVAGEDEVVCSGDLITLDASKSFDADGDLLKYYWDFGDSTSAEGVSVTKSFVNQGNYKVTLKVTDNSGLECNNSYDTKIVKVIESPVAFAGMDITGCANNPIYFNAFKSTDSDGIVNSFAWDFGDGTTGGGMETSHIYKEPGTYNVILTITGEESAECDNMDTDELIVTIEEAPMADFICLDSVAVNKNFTLDASLSKGNGNRIINYYWDFGDSSVGSGARSSHIYNKAGLYRIGLKIDTDSKAECNSASVSKSIYVNDAPIAVAGNDMFGNENDIFKFDASNSYDPNGEIVKYIWDFGDGTKSEGINVFHKFTKHGKYKVKLTVYDETTVSNNSDDDIVNVEVNALPIGEIIAPEFAFVNRPVLIEANNLRDIDGRIVSVEWAIGEFRDSVSSSFNYTFKEPGKKDIVCIITDNLGGVSEITKSISIYPMPEVFVENVGDVCINENVKFVAEHTLENNDLQIPIKWKLPNGDVIYGKTLETKFVNGGNDKLKILLIDPNNEKYILSEKIIDVFVNQSPVAKIAEFGEAYIGAANDEILFDASESFDPNGDALTYNWNFGDGNTGVGIKLFHKFDKPGNYKITLTVSDGRNCECDEARVTKYLTVKAR